MMRNLRNIWLVAAREYKVTARTRSFILTLVSVPVIIVVMAVLQVLLKPPSGNAFVMVDQTGLYAPAIEQQVDLDYQRDVLIRLSAYARRWNLQSLAPDAPWSRTQRWYDDGDVATFVAQGGAPAALKVFKGHVPADAPAFAYPDRWLYHAKTPRAVDSITDPKAFGIAIEPALHEDVATPDGPRPLNTAILIPKDFGPGNTKIHVYTDGRPSEHLLDIVRGELTVSLRTQVMLNNGLTTDQVIAIETARPQISVSAPPPGGGRDMVLIRSALPLAMTYMLFMSIMISGGKMLMGVIEERSNKLLESILACISPRDLMYGKLLGVMGVGLTIVAVWAGFAVAGAYGFQGQLSDFLRPALSSLHSPWIGLALLGYFICGYLIMSMIFLAVGALSDSLQDSQGYLQPLMLIFIIPYTLMLSTMISNPDSILPKVLSWIPFFTPYAMLARLGGGVEAYEIIGTSILMVAFVVVELIWLGRLFQSSLLNTGQSKKLGHIFKLMSRQAG